MTGTEYGIGIKNRFAVLETAGNDEEENRDVEAPIVSSKMMKAATNKMANSKSTGKVENKTATVVSGKRNNPKDKALKGTSERVVVPEEKPNVKENSRNVGEKTSHQGPRESRKGGQSARRNLKDRYTDSKGVDNDDAYNRRNDIDANLKEEEKAGEVKNDDENKGQDQELPVDENENKSEEKTLTLAEWKASQAPREKPVFNIRKPGEGEPSSKFEKLVLKKREDIGHDDQDEINEVYYPQRAGKLKLISDVGFTTGYQKRRGGRFNNSSRAGGGDGYGRDDTMKSNQIDIADKPRSRARFGSYGGYKHSIQAPRIDDTSDFPTLG